MNAKKSSNRSKPDLKPATPEQIGALAHELWIAQGCPAGSDIDIWLEAERQLHGGPPRPLEKDPIPAEPGRPGIDDDVALTGEEDRELDHIVSRPEQRGPTSLN